MYKNMEVANVIMEAKPTPRRASDRIPEDLEPREPIV